MINAIDRDEHQAVSEVAQSGRCLEGLCLSSLCLGGIHVEGTDTWGGWGRSGRPPHKWQIPLLAVAKTNAQTFPHLFEATASVSPPKSPTTAAVLAFLPVIANYSHVVSKRHLGSLNVRSRLQWNTGCLASRMLFRLSLFFLFASFCSFQKCDRNWWSMALACTETMIFTVQQKCSGKNGGFYHRKRDPPTLSWFLASLDRAHVQFSFFLFSRSLILETATGSHHDLDLTCTNNIPGLI